jgi:hypothetical protein
MDPAVMPLLRRQRRPPPASRAGLQPRHYMRTLAMPKTKEPWPLTSLREKLIKIGAKIVSHGRYVTFQSGRSRSVAADVRRNLFADRRLRAGARASIRGLRDGKGAYHDGRGAS